MEGAPNKPAHISMGGISIDIGQIGKGVTVVRNMTRTYVNLPQPTHTETTASLQHQYNQPSVCDVLTVYEKQTQQLEEILKNLPNETVTGSLIAKIADEFGKGWRRVFRHLKMSDASIDCAYQESGGQVKEAVHLLLVQWTRSAATPDVRTLTEALVRAEQMHIRCYSVD